PGRQAARTAGHMPSRPEALCETAPWSYTLPRVITTIGVLFISAAVMGSSFAADILFDDPVIARARNFQIRESDIQEAYVSHKATAAALGKPTPPAMEQRLKNQLLEKMIATKL